MKYTRKAGENQATFSGELLQAKVIAEDSDHIHIEWSMPDPLSYTDVLNDMDRIEHAFETDVRLLRREIEKYALRALDL